MAVLTVSGLALGQAALAPTSDAEAGTEHPARAATPQDRYAMAGGCYVVRALGADRYLARTEGGFAATASSASDAEPFHFQATDLGRYLLFGAEEDFLAVSDGAVGQAADEGAHSSPGAIASGLTRGATDALLDELAEGELGTASGRGAAVVIAEEPSELADWEIDGAAGAFTISLPALDKVLAVGEDGGLHPADPGTPSAFGFELAEGCAQWPEVDINVDGAAVGGATSYTEVRGYLDAHLHGMAFEFLGGRVHCGRPWHPYGVGYALRGCDEHEASGGRTHVFEAVLSGRDPVAGHDTTGWPTFKDWPAHQSLAYEQTYYRWIERAWRGGLRMYTNLLVENHALCDLYPLKRNSCNEMDAVRLQAQRLREFERYIDAQNGGPGRGWLRIVTDPFEARRVMNAGKLAVVLGIEVSVPLDCGEKLDQPQCGTGQIDAGLDEVYKLGVRQMELVNKFDNALAGVKGDGGSTGVIVNGGNAYSTGHFWRMEQCAEDAERDHTQPNVHDDGGTPEEVTGRDALVGTVLAAVGESGAAPAYGGGPHCNTLGLTDLGAHTVERIADMGMLFDPDHLSVKAASESLELLEAKGYSGVVSSHSWADDTVYRRVLALGGVVTPMAGSTSSFRNQWAKQRGWADDRFYGGIGYGSDINGFAAQGPPREGADPGVRYPFTGFGGTRIDKQVSGERVYDINIDGVAHYGLYPDWIEDLRLVAGEEIIADLERGPEAYLQTWERAIGIAGDSCRPDVPDLTKQDLKRLEQGMTPEQVLQALGQPHARKGDTFTYCLAGGRTALVRFGANGELSRVAVGDAPSTPNGRAVPAGSSSTSTEIESTPAAAVTERSATDWQDLSWLVLAGAVLALFAALRRRTTGS